MTAPSGRRYRSAGRRRRSPASSTSRRSTPGRAISSPTPELPGTRPSFHRPSREAILYEALAVLARHRGGSLSQQALLRELEGLLGREDPPGRLGGARLRQVLVRSPRIRLEVLYADRPGRRPFTRCPVCGGDLIPRLNRTLEGGRALVGYRCRTCPFWTPRRWRVPARYRFWLRR